MAFVKQKQRTGNVTESTLDGGSSTLDYNLAPVGRRSTLDKDFSIGWITQKQETVTTSGLTKVKQTSSGTWVKGKQV